MTKARVVRMVVYEGDAVKVLANVDRSVHGTKDWGGGVSITAETLKTEIFDVEETPQQEMTETDMLLGCIRREKRLRREEDEILWKPTQIVPES
jgi:hypothetical protein